MIAKLNINASSSRTELIWNHQGTLWWRKSSRIVCKSL